MRRLTRYLGGTLLAATAALAGPYQRTFEKSVDLGSGGHLSLDTFKGTIRLQPWDEDRVEVRARIEADPDSSESYGREAVDATRIEVSRDGDRVRIHSDYDNVPSESGRWFGTSRTLPLVHYEISAPRHIDLSIDDHKSTIAVGGFDGGIAVQTHKGDVSLERLSGEVELQTHKGHATLNGVDGKLAISTHKGTVEVSGLRGRFDVSTHKGDVAIDAVSLDGRSSASTHRGTIRIRVPDSQGADVRASLGRSGHLESDYALDGGVERSEEREIRGTINGGGPRIDLDTDRGDLSLTRSGG